MLKIGEFSKLMQISIRMLRYYDEVGLLKPAAVQEQSGYRLYSNDQIRRLKKILFLRDLGFSVEEMKELMDSWNENLVKERFQKKEQEIEEEILSYQKKLEQLKQAKEEASGERLKMRESITIKEVPDYNVISLRRKVTDYYAEASLWRELSEYIHQAHIEVMAGENSFAIYHDMEYKEKDVDIEVCAVVKHKQASQGDFVSRTVKGYKEMACLMVYGPYENIAPSYLAFTQWLEQHQSYHIIGADRQITHRGPWNEKDEKDYLVELQIPISTH